MNSKVSVIVPCYNQAQFLAETLDSVLVQTYENWECIIVNDGSTDNTEVIAKEYCNKDNRFIYHKKENGGLSSARNAGLNIAQGDYVQFLDSDDILLPNKLEWQICMMETNKSDVCVCHHSIFTTDKNQTWENVFSTCAYDFTYQNFIYNWGPGFIIAIHSGMFRLSFLQNHNIHFDERVRALEDWLFWTNIATKGASFSELKDKLVLYRTHVSSMSRDKSYMMNNAVKAYFCMYENLSNDDKKEFIYRGTNKLISYFLVLTRNVEAERRANSIDYKVGAFLMYPLHKTSSLLKKLIRKIKG